MATAVRADLAAGLVQAGEVPRDTIGLEARASIPLPNEVRLIWPAKLIATLWSNAGRRGK
jgi:hypothetical protein